MGKVRSGLAWSLIERGAGVALTFIVTVVMARLIGPAAYGLTGVLWIFIDTADALCDCGLSQALIQRGTFTHGECCAARWFNLLAASLLYAIVWIIAPHIAAFFHEPELSVIVRVLALLIPIRATGLVAKARLHRMLKFKAISMASLPATAIGGALGIVMARSGLGVWAIVGFQLTQALVYNILCLVSAGRETKNEVQGHTESPQAPLRPMLAYGSRLAVAGIINTLSRNFSSVVIGRITAGMPSYLGYFTRGRQFASIPPITTGTALQRVAFPLLSQTMASGNNPRSITLKWTSISALVIFPALGCIASCSIPLVYLLLGPDWGKQTAMCVSILCLGYCFYPFDALNLAVLQGAGRSDLFLRTEIYKKAIVVALLLGVAMIHTTPNGTLLWICIASVGGQWAEFVLNAYYPGRKWGITLKSQLGTMLRPIGWSIIAACCATAVLIVAMNRCDDLYHNIPLMLTVFITQIIIFAVIYAAGMWRQLRQAAKTINTPSPEHEAIS